MNARARRILIWGVLGLALAAGLVVAFQPQAVPVDFAVAARGALTVTVEEEGVTRIRDVFVLSVPIAGQLHRINLEVGDPVTVGETEVARIEPNDPAFLDVRGLAQAQAAVDAAEAAREQAAAEVEKAEAELAFAKTELDRARELISRGTIAQRTLDNAERSFRSESAALETTKATFRMRESELREARSRLLSPTETRRDAADCDCVTIAAPVSGRILRLFRESAGVVQAGEALLEIGDPTDLEIVVDLLSEDAVKVEPGQRVIIDAWGGAAPLEGRVERVEPYGFMKVSALGIEEQRVNVIVTITDDPATWQRLGHGYRVEARIVLWQGEDVLKLPLTALFRDDGQWTVFVERGGRAERQAVELGRRTEFEAEILGGLEAGARVVLHPSDRVSEGVRLAPRS